MIQNLVKLLRLPAAERRTLAEAGLVLVGARVALSVCSLRTCQAMVRGAPSARPAPLDLRSLALAVRRAAGGLRLGCLPQSLAICWLLARRGARGELRFGVRLNAGALRAHAWVEAPELGWRYDSDPAGGYSTLEGLE